MKWCGKVKPYVMRLQDANAPNFNQSFREERKVASCAMYVLPFSVHAVSESLLSNEL